MNIIIIFFTSRILGFGGSSNDVTCSRIIPTEHDDLGGDAILLNTICRQASLMDLLGVNSLSDPGFIFCRGKSISQPDKFCIRSNVLFHEANVFPVEFSDDRALCFRFTFGQLGLAWEPEACTSTHSSAGDEMFGRGFQTAGER